MRKLTFIVATGGICSENNDCLNILGLELNGYKTPLKYNFEEKIGKVLSIETKGNHVWATVLINEDFKESGLYPALGFTTLDAYTRKEKTGVTIYDKVLITSVGLCALPNQDKNIKSLP